MHSKSLLSSCFLMFLFFFSSTSFAESEKWGTQYDIFFERKDLEKKYSLTENGEEKRSVIIPKQTSISQTRKDGQVSTSVWDISENGAVLCVREIYTTIRIALEHCDDLKYSIAQKELELAFEKIDKFVLENSIVPVSQEDLDTDYKHRSMEFDRRYSIEQKRACMVELGEETSKFIEHMAQWIEKMPLGEIKNKTEMMLAVPRLPTMNPCL